MKEFISDPATKLAIAGALGGVVRWFTVRDKMWPDGLINVMVGAICAVYLSPIVIPMLEPVIGKITTDIDQVAGFSGFVIGIGGLSVSGFVMDFWRKRRESLTGNDNDKS